MWYMNASHSYTTWIASPMYTESWMNLIHIPHESRALRTPSHEWISFIYHRNREPYVHRVMNESHSYTTGITCPIYTESRHISHMMQWIATHHSLHIWFEWRAHQCRYSSIESYADVSLFIHWIIIWIVQSGTSGTIHINEWIMIHWILPLFMNDDSFIYAHSAAIQEWWFIEYCRYSRGIMGHWIVPLFT